MPDPTSATRAEAASSIAGGRGSRTRGVPSDTAGYLLASAHRVRLQAVPAGNARGNAVRDADEHSASQKECAAYRRPRC